MSTDNLDALWEATANEPPIQNAIHAMHRVSVLLDEIEAEMMRLHAVIYEMRTRAYLAKTDTHE